MPDEASSYPAPRARPVADLPLRELTGQADELARAWAVALIVARPPRAIAGVPLEDLARDGPRLCAQVLRALESDAELERLIERAPDGGREELALAPGLAGLSGASDVGSTVAAVEALRGVLWEALLAELRRPVPDRSDTHLLADLADRLAYVCAMTLAAALPAALGQDLRIPGQSAVVVAGGESPASTAAREPAVPERPVGQGEVVIVDERAEDAPSSRRVVVAREGSREEGAVAAGADTAGAAGAWERRTAPTPRERQPQEPAPARESGGPASDTPSPPAGGARTGDARPIASEPPGPRAADASAWAPRGAPARPAPEEIEIRDERVEEGPAAWIRSIGGELERFVADGRPFAVLLIELMDMDGLNRSEEHREVARAAAQVERTLELQLRTISEAPSGSLTREAPGRFWLTAPGVDAMRVGALAEQVAHAVRRSVCHRGAPLEVAVGSAVCPDDGLQAAALAAHADVALYAARAGGSAGGGAAG